MPQNPKTPRQKKPKERVDMFITPGWVEDEEPVTRIPEPVDRSKRMLTDQQRKALKLQRS